MWLIRCIKIATTKLVMGSHITVGAFLNNYTDSKMGRVDDDVLVVAK